MPHGRVGRSRPWGGAAWMAHRPQNHIALWGHMLLGPWGRHHKPLIKEPPGRGLSYCRRMAGRIA